MAARVKEPWLGDTIEAELKDAISWDHDHTSLDPNDTSDTENVAMDASIRFKVEAGLELKSLPSRANPPRDYCNDGSNLRISCPKDNTKYGWVQIVQFWDYEGAVQATVSDGYTIIRAKFSKTSMDAFAVAKKGKSLTQGTRGNVLHVNQYEIVATTLGPKDSHVTLLIQDFILKGCMDNPTFGQPVPIEERPGVQTLLLSIGDILDSKRARVSVRSPIRRRHERTTMSKRGESSSKAAPEDQGGNAAASSLQATVASQTHLRCSPSEKAGPGRELRERSPKSTDKTALTARDSPALPSQVILATQTWLERSSPSKPDVGNIHGVNLHLPMAANRHRNNGSGYALIPENKKKSEDLLRRLGLPIGEPNSSKRTKLSPTPELPTVAPSMAEDACDSHEHDPATGGRMNKMDGICKSSTNLTSTENNDTIKVPHYVEQVKSSNMVDGTESKDICGNLTEQKLVRTDLEPEDRLCTSQQAEKPDHRTFFYKGNFLFVARCSSGLALTQVQKTPILKRPSSWQHPENGQFIPLNMSGEVLGALNALAEKRAAKGILVKRDDGHCHHSVFTTCQTNPLLKIASAEHSDQGGDSCLLHSSTDSDSHSDWSESCEEEILMSPSEWPPTQEPVTQIKNGILPPDSSALERPSSTQYSYEICQKAHTDIDGAASHHVALHETAPGLSTTISGAVLVDDLVSSTKINPKALEKISYATRPLIAIDGTTLKAVNRMEYPSTAAEAARSPPCSNDPDISISAHQPDTSDLELEVPNSLEESPLQRKRQKRRSPAALNPAEKSQDANVLAVETFGENHRKGQSTKVGSSEIKSHLQRDWNVSRGPRTISPNEHKSSNHASITREGFANCPMPGYSSVALAIDGQHSDSIDPPTDDMVDRQLQEEMRTASQRNVLISRPKLTHKQVEEWDSNTVHGAKEVSVPEVLELHCQSETPKRKLGEPPYSAEYKRYAKKQRINLDVLNQAGQSPLVEDPALIARKHKSDFFKNARRVFHGSSSDNLAHNIIVVSSYETSPTPVAVQRQVLTETHDQIDLASSISDHAYTSHPQQQRQRHSPRNPRSAALLSESELLCNAPKTPSAMTNSQQSDNPTKTAPALTFGVKLFNQFASTYPIYKGDFKHFCRMCNKISYLLKDGRAPHKSVWDDFIIRHKIEYGQYLSKCNEEVENPLPYEAFYAEAIDEPLYKQRIVDPTNLGELVIHSGDRMSITPAKSGNRQSENTKKASALVRTRRSSVKTSREQFLNMCFSMPEDDGSSRQTVPGAPCEYGSPKNVPTAPRSMLIGQPYPRPGSRGVVGRVEPSSTNTKSSQKSSRSLPWVKSSNATASPSVGKAIMLEKGTNQCTKEGQPAARTEWWEDDNTPFKDWARQFMNLKVFNGVLAPAIRTDLQHPRVSRINVLAWRL